MIERTHLNTVTPDCFAMVAGLLASRSPFSISVKTVVAQAAEIVAEVQRIYDEQAKADEAAEHLAIADEVRDRSREYIADATRALAATRIASSRRLAVLPLNESWVVKPDGDNELRIGLPNTTPMLAVLHWARLHAPEDLVSCGVDPRSEAFEPLPAEALAEIASAQNQRGAH